MSSVFPRSFRDINALPEAEKTAIYQSLIPNWVYPRYGIDPATLCHVDSGELAVFLRCPQGSRAMEMTVWHEQNARDPLIYLNMIDTFNQQLMVLLLVINDPDSPRFDVDVDEKGQDTYFGTRARNLGEELRALEAGLAPGQVRMGLRAFKSSVPNFEQFIQNMGHDLFLIEPLAYHNAVAFERYGFAYTHGRREMEMIHAEFMPGGGFYQRLDDDNPFRRVDAWQTIRGRSWAIHDGILGHPYTGFQMYKRIGVNAGVNTFPGGRW